MPFSYWYEHKDKVEHNVSCTGSKLIHQVSASIQGSLELKLVNLPARESSVIKVLSQRILLTNKKKLLFYCWYPSAPYLYSYNYPIIMHLLSLSNQAANSFRRSFCQSLHLGLFQVAVEYFTDTKSPVHSHFLEWVCNHSLVLRQVPLLFVLFPTLCTFSSSPVFHSFLFSPPPKYFPTNNYPSDLDKVPFRYLNVTIAVKWAMQSTSPSEKSVLSPEDESHHLFPLLSSSCANVLAASGHARPGNSPG